jgi:hypothetical protein
MIQADAERRFGFYLGFASIRSKPLMCGGAQELMIWLPLATAFISV